MLTRDELRMESVRSRWPSAWAWLAAGLVIWVSMLVLGRVEQSRNAEHLVAVRESTLRNIANIRCGAEVAISKRVYVARSLAAYVCVNPEISDQQFDRLAAVLIQGTEGVLAAALLRGVPVNSSFPAQEIGVGSHPLDSPDRQGLPPASRSGKPWLTGPVHLADGGKIFIHQAPVYTSNPDKPVDLESYWGLVAVTIDYAGLVKEIQTYVPAGFSIAIHQSDSSHSSPGRILFGEAGILANFPLATSITLPTGDWRLLGVPRGGWPKQVPGGEYRRALHWLVAVSVAAIAFVLVGVSCSSVQAIAYRRQAANESYKTRQMLEKTAQMARVGSWEFDPLQESLSWSDQVCAIHELPAGHQPMLGEAISYYTEQSRPIIQAAVQRCIADHDAYDLELQMITASGRLIWVRSIGEPEVIDGRCVRIWGACQDVTDQHLAQEQLNLTQHAIDHSADAVFFINH